MEATGSFHGLTRAAPKCFEDGYCSSQGLCARIGCIGAEARKKREEPTEVQPTAPTEPMPAAVFRPNYYARYVIEPITFIMANKLPFDIASVVKYVLRYDAKNGLEDLQKARRFIDIRIETLEREARVAKGEDAKAVWSTTL